LLLLGSAGLAIIYVAMGLSYARQVHGWPMLVLVLAAIGIYAMSLAPVVWVVISEIFPNRIRGAAMSVAVTSLWIACFFLTYTFPILNKGMGEAKGAVSGALVKAVPMLKEGLGPAKLFLLYAVICVIGFIFIFFKLPETKGKTLEQIERELVD
jgi:MFS family permease